MALNCLGLIRNRRKASLRIGAETKFVMLNGPTGKALQIRTDEESQVVQVSSSQSSEEYFGRLHARSAGFGLSACLLAHALRINS